MTKFESKFLRWRKGRTLYVGTEETKDRIW